MHHESNINEFKFYVSTCVNIIKTSLYFLNKKKNTHLVQLRHLLHYGVYQICNSIHFMQIRSNLFCIVMMEIKTKK